MKRYLILCVLSVTIPSFPAAAAELAWKQTPSSLALVSGESVVWQCNYNEDEGRPYFHPLTVAGSPTLTDLRPADHPWHLAFWFSWKFIDGVNYWEPDPQTGKPAGVTEMLEVKADPRPDHSARLEFQLAYHPAGQPPAVVERRVVEVSSPTAAGQWHVDWQSTFTAGDAEVRLDRTPLLGEPDGKSYGGYAGLSLRLTPELRPWRFVGAEGPVTVSNTRSRWMAFSGPLPDGKAAAILVLDHPRSFRHPSPWYLINGMPYFSPAPLYYSPHVLPPGRSLSLRYRVAFLPGDLDPSAAENAWKQFAARP